MAFVQLLNGPSNNLSFGSKGGKMTFGANYVGPVVVG
jgi:hypothetical protein